MEWVWWYYANKEAGENSFFPLPPTGVNVYADDKDLSTIDFTRDDELKTLYNYFHSLPAGESLCSECKDQSEGNDEEDLDKLDDGESRRLNRQRRINS